MPIAVVKWPVRVIRSNTMRCETAREAATDGDSKQPPRYGLGCIEAMTPGRAVFFNGILASWHRVCLLASCFASDVFGAAPPADHLPRNLALLFEEYSR